MNYPIESPISLSYFLKEKIFILKFNKKFISIPDKYFYDLFFLVSQHAKKLNNEEKLIDSLGNIIKL